MQKLVRIVSIVFGVPWLIFGAQHIMFADFVAKLVPAYFPARAFWAYLTGAAMIAAGASLIVNIKARLAASLLGLMILMFVMLIHAPKLAGGSLAATDWTRALQDLAIASAAFMLAGLLAEQNHESGALTKIARASRYLFAILLIIFGVQQFLNLDFLSAKVALYLPWRMFWVYLTGVSFIIAGASVLVNRKTQSAAFALGTLMLILNLLLHGYQLANSPQTPLLWTAAMLDLAITCAVFILAAGSGKQKIVVSA